MENPEGDSKLCKGTVPDQFWPEGGESRVKVVVASVKEI